MRRRRALAVESVRLEMYSEALVTRYRMALAIAATVVFFSGLPVYLFVTEKVSFPPLYWIIAFFVLVMPLALSRRSVYALVSSRLVLWSLVYVASGIVWFWLSSHSEIASQELETRILAALFLPALVPVFADRDCMTAARHAVVLCVLLGVALNVYELFRPLTFSSTWGRSAGLYVNPNISGSAMVAGMVVSIEVVNPRLRSLFALLVGAAVIATFSRSAVVVWLIVVVAMLLLGGLRVRSLVTASAIAGVLIGVAVTQSPRLQSAARAAAVANADVRLWERLNVTDRSISVADASAATRFEVAEKAWELFGDRPLLGHGVGATTEWSGDASTHNIYLRHLAEYGVLGILLFPLLILAMVSGVTPLTRNIAVAFSLFLICWGLFSHNLLDSRHLLVCVALTAAVVADARKSRSGRGVTAPTV